MADAVEIAKERIATLAAEIGTSAAFRRQRANVRVGSSSDLRDPAAPCLECARKPTFQRKPRLGVG